MPLTLPGFLHDFGSAVHPMAAGSPFFSALPLASHGLQWIHGESPLAHPLDDGTAVMLERDLADQDRELGADAKSWRSLVQPVVDHWDHFTQDALGPLVRIPGHPVSMARFGMAAFQPAHDWLAHHFASPRTRALFAGLAAHSFLSLDRPLSSAVALVLAAAAHAVGWPIPRGGSRSITHALIAHLHNWVARSTLPAASTRQHFAICSAKALSLSATLRRVNCLHWQGTNSSQKSVEQWSDFNRARERSRSTSLSQSLFHGARESAGARSACTLAARSKRSPRPKMQSLMDSIPKGRLFLSRSRLSLRPDARAARQTRPLGILSCAQRIDHRYDQSH